MRSKGHMVSMLAHTTALMNFVGYFGHGPNIKQEIIPL